MRGWYKRGGRYIKEKLRDRVKIKRGSERLDVCERVIAREEKEEGGRREKGKRERDI